jgi:hypothetical protein
VVVADRLDMPNHLGVSQRTVFETNTRPKSPGRRGIKRGLPFLFFSIAPHVCQAVNQLARCSSRQGDEVCLKKSWQELRVLRGSAPRSQPSRVAKAGCRHPAARVVGQLLPRAARRAGERVADDWKPLGLVAALGALSRQPVLQRRRATVFACRRIVLRTVFCRESRGKTERSPRVTAFCQTLISAPRRAWIRLRSPNTQTPAPPPAHPALNP